MKKLLLISLLALVYGCKKESTTPASSNKVDVIYEIVSNTTAPIHAHYGDFYHNASETGSHSIAWEILAKGTFTRTSTYELHSVGAEGDALCPSSGDWLYRIKTKSGKVLQENKPVFYRTGGYEYYSTNLSVYPE